MHNFSIETINGNRGDTRWVVRDLDTGLVQPARFHRESQAHDWIAAHQLTDHGREKLAEAAKLDTVTRVIQDQLGEPYKP